MSSSRLDTDVPDAVDLSYGNHQHTGEAAFERYAESADHTENNRYKAGNAGCGAWYKEAEDKAAADNADNNTVGLSAQLGQNDESNTLIKSCLCHSGGQKHGGGYQAEGCSGKALEAHAQACGGAENFAGCRVRRKAYKYCHECDDNTGTDRVGDCCCGPDNDGKDHDAEHSLACD